MDVLKEYRIPFAGLGLGKHQFDFKVRDPFFESFDILDYRLFDVQVEMEMKKTERMLELLFHFKGSVELRCDLTDEPFSHEIDEEAEWIVKFGPAFNNDDEEVLVLPYEAYEVDLSPFIRDIILLSIPMKRVHPGIEDGTLESEILDKLEELSPGGRRAEDETETDPIWDKLKEIKKD